MDIENLSVCVEMSDEEADTIVGGAIDYDAIADSINGWYESTGDALESMGLDGDPWYSAAIY